MGTRMITFLRGFKRLHFSTIKARSETAILVVVAALIASTVGVVGWFWVTGFTGLIVEQLPTPVLSSPDTGTFIHWAMSHLAKLFVWMAALFFYMTLLIGLTIGRKDVDKSIRDGVRKASSFYRGCIQAGASNRRS